MSGLEEVTISQSYGITFKVTKAAELLEKNGTVTITAINTAISSAIALVELLKHRVKGLHQVNAFEKVPSTNRTRVVFKLGFKAQEVGSSGYQQPIPESEVQEKSLTELKKPPWGERTNVGGEGKDKDKDTEGKDDRENRNDGGRPRRPRGRGFGRRPYRGGRSFRGEAPEGREPAEGEPEGGQSWGRARRPRRPYRGGEPRGRFERGGRRGSARGERRGRGAWQE